MLILSTGSVCGEGENTFVLQKLNEQMVLITGPEKGFGIGSLSITDDGLAWFDYLNRGYSDSEIRIDISHWQDIPKPPRSLWERIIQITHKRGI